jgi:hypothetical protein
MEVGVSDGHSVYSYLLTLVHRSWIFYTLKMEAIRSSKTSVNKISTQRHIPEDGILQFYSLNSSCQANPEQDSI